MIRRSHLQVRGSLAKQAIRAIIKGRGGAHTKAAGGFITGERRHKKPIRTGLGVKEERG